VRVNTQSDTLPINAVSGIVAFDSTRLEALSVSKVGSIISLWVKEPSFTNSGGNISFEGIVLNPGFSGSGNVLSVTFRAKTSGTTELSFGKSSVLANDGSGTEVLSARGSARFLIEEKNVVVAQTSEPTDTQVSEPELKAVGPIVRIEGAPLGYIASSSARFLFSFDPERVKALRLLFDDAPESTPTVVYEPALLERRIDDIPLGVSYLHAQTKDEDGWSEVTHLKVMRDATSPSDILVERVGGDVEGRFIVAVRAIDAEGIERIEGSLKDAPFFTIATSSVGTYVSEKLLPGTYELLLRAYDLAGNSIEKRVPFEIASYVSKETQPQTHDDSLPFSAVRTSIIAFGVGVGFLIALSLATLFWYIRSSSIRRHSAIHTETREALETLTQSFVLIAQDIEKHVHTLGKTKKKRTLTKEESRVLKDLTHSLKGAEAVLKREIEDIEKAS
jgi:hypothetical protein